MASKRVVKMDAQAQKANDAKSLCTVAYNIAGNVQARGGWQERKLEDAKYHLLCAIEALAQVIHDRGLMRDAIIPADEKVGELDDCNSQAKQA